MPTDPDEIERLLGRIETKLQRAWRTMVRSVKDENSIHEMAQRIAAGDTQSLLRGVAEAAEKFALDVNGGYVAAGQKAARWLDGEVSSSIAVRFDFTSEEAVGWMTEHLDGFVSGMVEGQQATVERVITRGRARGLSDLDIAAEVRDSIGLAPYQVDHVETYRAALEAGDYSNAVDRQLADGRYETAIRRAEEEGTHFAPKRIEAMVDSYRANWVEFRGEVVALAEAEAAMGAGMDELLRQAIEAGDVDPSLIVRTWVTRHDARVRTSHRLMNGQQRPFGVPFISGNGNELMYPGDENGPSDDVCGCRCFLVLSLRGAGDASSIAA